MTCRVLSAILLVAVLALATTCMAQDDTNAALSTQPLLFVSKTTSSNDLILGTPVEVVVTVYNYGQSPAFDVKISDVLDDGTEHMKEVDELSYSDSVTLRYSVTPKALGNYAIPVAQVSYNLEKGNTATQRIAFSNIVGEAEAYFKGENVDDQSYRGVVSVLTRDRYDRLHARFIKETIAYIFLGTIPALFPYVLFTVKQSQIDALLRRPKRNTAR